jgi:hypothetical protein
MKYQQIYSGRWYLADFDHTICCDCLLVHREAFKMVKGKLYWKASRDKKKTAQLRKKAGITVVKQRCQK